MVTATQQLSSLNGAFSHSVLGDQKFCAKKFFATPLNSTELKRDFSRGQRKKKRISEFSIIREWQPLRAP
jgi:hypothetical protein